MKASAFFGHMWLKFIMRFIRLMHTSCTVVFLIFPINTTFQSEIIKDWLNSNLTCGTKLRQREQIIQGEKQIAQGEDKVSTGERQLNAAKLQLRQGREQMRLAKFALVACGLRLDCRCRHGCDCIDRGDRSEGISAAGRALGHSSVLFYDYLLLLDARENIRRR